MERSHLDLLPVRPALGVAGPILGDGLLWCCLRPDKFCCPSEVTWCVGDLALDVQIHALVVKTGLGNDVRTYGALVDM
jgi:hypothetical protein